HAERRAPPRPLADLDRAAQIDHRALDKRQAQPGPTRARGEERHEDLRALVGGDSRPVVFDLDLEETPGASPHDPNRDGPPRFLADVRGVLYEIPERAAEEALVSDDRAELAEDLDRDARGRGRLERAEQRGHVDRGALRLG